ncbi:hypothetical protein P7H74_15130 [Enterococcus devriesei]|uniref:hypothetical protein n=1 Tax=Enterococcus devriesei TaxID=319970 RepID=UPI001C0FDB0E|nr:hypothetical protein [Enterococcus devriesei]MBU5366008.1 hypothetical protein [Enterococcus devriesei]MDT2823083.1 hypothetical protein [Enterococcus devriesei]
MKNKQALFQKKRFFIPLAILLGILGFSPMLVSLLGVSDEAGLNPDYYSSADESLFKSKKGAD